MGALALAILLVSDSGEARHRSSDRAPTAEPSHHRLELELTRALRKLPQVEGVPEPLACAQRLAEIADYAPVPSRPGPASCGAIDLVRLDGIAIGDGARVTLEPPAVLRCSMAEAVARLVRDHVAPAAAEIGTPLAAIATNASYQCRARNNLAGAKPSEHGRGNALDITAIRPGDGRVIGLTGGLAPKPFLTRVRDAACERFNTVLGPGADAFHADHVHLDLAERKNGHRICQWQVRDATVVDVPLPRPRPLVRATDEPRKRRL